MKTNHELFDQVLQCTRNAAQLLEANVNGEPLDRPAIADIRRTLQEALCAATSLESIMAGNPPPKEG